MTTRSRSSRSKPSKYKRYTPVQLVTMARQLQRQFVAVSKMPTWKTCGSKMPTWKACGNKTVVQKQIALKRELNNIARLLRTKTVQQINARIKVLKDQAAKYYGVKLSSTKTSTAAVKRLKAKLNNIQKCNRVTPLIALCAAIKVTSFKNATSIAKAGNRSTARRRNTARRRSTTTRRHATMHARSGRRTSSTYALAAKHRQQTKSLKKEIGRLKQRNNFMKRLASNFRKEVAQLQRHYGTLHNKQKWKVIQGRKVGQDVSNIVRFNNALSSAFTKQQRRVG